MDQLSTCDALTSLTLTANPVSELVAYRRAVVHLVPQLTVLDEEPIVSEDVPLPYREHILSLVYRNVLDKDYQKNKNKSDGTSTSNGEAQTRPRHRAAAAAANRVPSPHDDAADITLSLRGELDVSERIFDKLNKSRAGDIDGESPDDANDVDARGKKSGPEGGRGGRPMASGHRFVSKSKDISLMASRPGHGGDKDGSKSFTGKPRTLIPRTARRHRQALSLHMGPMLYLQAAPLER